MNNDIFVMPDYLWLTANHRQIWVSSMAKKHINNTIKMLQGVGKQKPPEFWFGRSKKDWIIIFNDELDYRNTNHLFEKEVRRGRSLEILRVYNYLLRNL
jgi:hypothetical protein